MGVEDDNFCEDGKTKKRTHFLEQTGLQRKKTDSLGLATSKWYYIKHIGYNDIQVLRGRDGKGELAWRVDVKAQFAGWAITVRNAEGLPLLHLKKDVTFARLLGWDKGTTVNIHSSEDLQEPSEPSESGSEASKRKKFLRRFSKTKKSLATREKLIGEPSQNDVIVPEMTEKEYDALNEQDLAELPAKSVTTIKRNHAFRSNENVFTHNGREYAWNYWIFLGSTLHLTDLETQEELAVVQLLPTWRWQIISSWSWRLDGTLEIKDEGVRRGMEDMIVATLTAMLEWRKHNNKVWIVAAAIA